MPDSTPPPRRRLLRRVSAFFLLLVVLATAWVLWHTRDRNRGYTVALNLQPSPASPPPTLRVGFGRERVTPDLTRAVWLAGFANGRQASAVHDDLWAVAAVIDDGSRRIGIVALDAIGLFHDDVVAIRRRLPAELRIDYTIVTATHNHSAPDLMGLWGPRTGQSGVDAVYRELVIAAAANSIVAAAAVLAPARLALTEIELPTAGLVADSRDPQVFDATLRLMHFTSPSDGATVGTIVNWADHPETPWAENTEITADFPGYLRDILENGIQVDGARVVAGLGGMHLYVNGAIGGLMTTNPETTVPDVFAGQEYAQPSHDKARAVGRRLGEAILTTLIARPSEPEPAPRIGVIARTIELRLDNPLFRLASAIGTIDRGQPHWNRVRSEVALVTIGDAAIACVPGELYPEIANGGVTHPPGADFDIEPVELPPLREMMPGRVKFLFGLANDEVGYIIPKSEWDDGAPWLYGAPVRLYGEINSLGPETGPAIHRALRDVFDAAGTR
jgi:hypothetical protein